MTINHSRWLISWVVAAGLGAGVLAGGGVALADDGAAPNADNSTTMTGLPRPDSTHTSTLPGGLKSRDGLGLKPRRNNPDALGDMSTVETMRLQQLLDRRTKMLEALSNTSKKLSHVGGQIAGNLK